MADKPSYGNKHIDKDWGCDYYEIINNSSINKIKVCHVKINQINIMASELAKTVLDTSWMMNLDKGCHRAYNRTVKETSEALVKIFQSTAASTIVGSEFGEIMVTIGSTKALETIFDHFIPPIAELWKPQIKQNEGFDFHTVCNDKFINFGEAKFSARTNPHGKAIKQAQGFINNEKHLRDRVHLVNLVSNDAIKNLDNDSYGIVASFSINTEDPLVILKNAIETAEERLSSEKIKSIYLVGISQ